MTTGSRDGGAARLAAAARLPPFFPERAVATPRPRVRRARHGRPARAAPAGTARSPRPRALTAPAARAAPAGTRTAPAYTRTTAAPGTRTTAPGTPAAAATGSRTAAVGARAPARAPAHGAAAFTASIAPAARTAPAPARVIAPGAPGAPSARAARTALRAASSSRWPGAARRRVRQYHLDRLVVVELVTGSIGLPASRASRAPGRTGSHDDKRTENPAARETPGPCGVSDFVRLPRPASRPAFPLA